MFFHCSESPKTLLCSSLPTIQWQLAGKPLHGSSKRLSLSLVWGSQGVDVSEWASDWADYADYPCAQTVKLDIAWYIAKPCAEPESIWMHPLATTTYGYGYGFGWLHMVIYDLHDLQISTCYQSLQCCLSMLGWPRRRCTQRRGQNHGFSHHRGRRLQQPPHGDSKNSTQSKAINLVQHKSCYLTYLYILDIEHPW